MREPGSDPNQDEFSVLKTSLLLSCCFILPIFSPVPFSWFSGFLAVPVFYLLRTLPKQRGKVVIRNTLLLVGLLGLASFEKLPAVALTLTFIPLGYSLYASAEKGEAPWMGVGKGTLVLAATWLLFGLGLAASFGVNPYTELKLNLDNLLSELYETAKTSEIPADALIDFKQWVDSMRELAPRILPGVLVTSIMITVWMNQLLGNIILIKTRPERAAWPEYRNWLVPDKFVWVLITAGIILLIGSGTLRDLGLCVCFISGVIYFFQGLAILFHYFNKWKIPNLLRIIMVLVIIIQTMAFLLVAVVGLIDTWKDFRQLRPNDPQPV